MKARTPDLKQCRACGEHKSPDDFYWRRCKCKACICRASAAWKKANPERRRATMRAWHQANADSERERQRAWREANPDRHRKNALDWQRDNPERSREIRYVYIRANRGKVRNWCARRRAAQRRAVPAWADHAAIEAIYTEAASRAGKWHVDHIVPLQGATVSGLHCEANLQILPSHENESKHNKWWPDMFGPEPRGGGS